ncbi:MAG: pilus assembly protein PilM [Peptostreptococcaceae bacterium]|nr:pilus assembly protein PilM [Peptostreptococcaceae bacterium]
MNLALKLGKKTDSKPESQEKKGRPKREKREKQPKQARSSRASKRGSVKKTGKCLCLDLGSYSIKGAVGVADSSGLKVDSAFEAVLPEGFYENGRIRDRAEFKNILGTALSQNSIKVKDVVVTIDTSELIKREIVFPDVEGVDLEEAIVYEIGDHLPIDVNNYVLQPRVMAHFSEDGQKKQRVLVAALPKDLVETLFFSLQEAGLRPLALDIHSNAIEKIFNEKYMPSLYREDKIFVFADLGYKMTNIVIVEGQDYRFNRILRFGGSFLDSSSRERISRESVVEMLESTSRGVGQNPQSDTIFSQISAWADDIEKVINYYQSRAANQPIEKILIYGGCSRFRDMDLFFEKRLGVPVVIVEHLDRVDFPSAAQRELFKYVNALSALIRR